MRFCQVDGTPLVDDAPPLDPFKTMVVSSASSLAGSVSEPIELSVPEASPAQPTFGSEAPAQPTFEPPAPEPPTFELDTPAQPTFGAEAPAQPIFTAETAAIHEPDELLDLPGANDPLKTMYVSEEEMRQALGGSPVDLELTPDPPEFIASEISASVPPEADMPSYGEAPFTADERASSLSSPAASFDASVPSIPSPFDAAPIANIEPIAPKEPSKPLFDEQETMMQPPASPFSEPSPPIDATPEPVFSTLSEPEPEQSPQAPPFKEPESLPAVATPAYEEQSPAAWTPPPPPDASWQNQEIGSNTPFQPPPAGVGGQNKTLPIVSLILGILSVCCYISPITGLIALITGYLGMKNVKDDPDNYGGRGLAMAGMITGGIFFLVGVVYWVLIILMYAGIIAGSFMPRY